MRRVWVLQASRAGGTPWYEGQLACGRACDGIEVGGNLVFQILAPAGGLKRLLSQVTEVDYGIAIIGACGHLHSKIPHPPIPHKPRTTAGPPAVSSKMSGEKNNLSGAEINSHALPPTLHALDIIPRPGWFHSWEHWRPLWIQEVVAEFFGVFFYCYAGMGATASLNIGILTNQPALGSEFPPFHSGSWTDPVFFVILKACYRLDWAMTTSGLGITFSITICAMTSGGHFNPAVTLTFAERYPPDFPWTKVPRYILAQTMGAFVASLLVYIQYYPYILDLDATLIKEGKAAEIFSAVGTAGIISVGFAPATVATNTARDLGMASGALSGQLIYEVFLSDTSRVVTLGSREHISNMDRHHEHKTYRYNLRREHLRNRNNSIGFMAAVGADKHGFSENERFGTSL
ncbi:hypothetical protein BS47DRAFT_1398705 [Hydnum rufescens UP504]|uniref:Aquaporin-like protein n=1 Tax=Hydnum rufescens UP504 TaxID=1448309 RepID=A0A9P6AL87_9AGAM|nr:hypothetical protein BS47DRAFT_1398705 [Hydnum rufescens UP504]